MLDNDKHFQTSRELITHSLSILAAMAIDFIKGVRKNSYAPRSVQDHPITQNTDDVSHQ